MSCPPVFFANESGNVMSITPVGGNSGTLKLLDPPLNPGPGGPFLPNQAFSFVVVGSTATCTFASNASGFISTVLADVITAFNTDPTMSTLGLAASVGVGSLADAQTQSWSCTGPVNMVLGLKGMKVYPVPV